MSLKNFKIAAMGYLNGTILAILNLCVTVMPPIKFQLSRTRFGGRCCLKNFKMAAVAAILDIGTERFSNSESLCHCDASHQVLAQSDLRLGRRCPLKNFKMAGGHGGHLGYRNGLILAILNLSHCDASHQVSAQSDMVWNAVRFLFG